MLPVYEHGGVTIYHSDCRAVIPLLPAGVVDLVLTDPPYAEQTHAGARTGDWSKETRALVDFAPISSADLRAIIESLALACRAWLVATMDLRHTAEFMKEPPAGWRFVRFGAWVKPNGTPQFTGDRPGQGWESVCVLHREGVPMRWNGGGRTAVWTHCKVASDHPTGKPLPLFRELLALFSDPGAVVLDPFAGAGTTLVAAKQLGRRAIGCEIERRHIDTTIRRLGQEALQFTPPPAPAPEVETVGLFDK